MSTKGKRGRRNGNLIEKGGKRCREKRKKKTRNRRGKGGKKVE